jgi:hypothetical protein
MRVASRGGRACSAAAALAPRPQVVSAKQTASEAVEQRERMAAEVARTNRMFANLEQRVQQLEQDNLGLGHRLDEERKRCAPGALGLLACRRLASGLRAAGWDPCRPALLACSALQSAPSTLHPPSAPTRPPARARRTTSAARSWQAELDALSGCPRDKWPAAVRRLVDEVEAQVGAEWALKLGEETDALEAQYSGELQVGV